MEHKWGQLLPPGPWPPLDQDVDTAPPTPRWKLLEDHKVTLSRILSEAICTVSEEPPHAWVTGLGCCADWGTLHLVDTLFCTEELSHVSGNWDDKDRLGVTEMVMGLRALVNGAGF